MCHRLDTQKIPEAEMENEAKPAPGTVEEMLAESEAPPMAAPEEAKEEKSD